MGREAPRRVILLSDLLGSVVADDAGTTLGHVHDVRVRRAGDRYEVEGLVVGPRGLAVRLGMHKADEEEPLRSGDLIRWEDVTAVEDGRVVVSSARRPRRAGDPGGPAGSR
jgi:sporulation protein YlmC with PRC-barrel domain